MLSVSSHCATADSRRQREPTNGRQIFNCFWKFGVPKMRPNAPRFEENVGTQNLKFCVPTCLPFQTAFGGQVGDQKTTENEPKSDRKRAKNARKRTAQALQKQRCPCRPENDRKRAQKRPKTSQKAPSGPLVVRSWVSPR